MPLSAKCRRPYSIWMYAAGLAAFICAGIAHPAGLGAQQVWQPVLSETVAQPASSLGSQQRNSWREALVVAQAAVEAPELPVTLGFRDALSLSANGRFITYVVAIKSVAENSVTMQIRILDRSSRGRARVVASLPPSPTQLNVRPRISPDGRTIAYIEQQATSIVFVDVANSTRRSLTPSLVPAGKSAKIEHMEWSPRGERLAVSYSESRPSVAINHGISVDASWIGGSAIDEGPTSRLAVIDAASGKVVVATAYKRFIGDFSWSPDGEQIAFIANAQGAKSQLGYDQALFSLNTLTGFERVLVDEDGPEDSPRWSPDGKQLAFIAARNSNAYRPRQLGVLDMARGKPRYFGSSWHSTPRFVVWVGNSQVMFMSAVKMGCPAFHLDLTTGSRSQVSADDLSCIVAMQKSDAGDYIVFQRQTFNEADELWGTSGKYWSPTQLTQLSDGLVLPRSTIQVVSWPRPGGNDLVHGIVIRPEGFGQQRLPMIVLNPGGPSMVAPSAYNINSQQMAHILVERGYMVFIPNTRGRGGYSPPDTAAIRSSGDYLPGPFSDMMSGVELIVSQGLADPNRLGIVGFSYGAHLTAYAITQTNRFKAAIIGDPLFVDFVYTGRMNTPFSSMVESGLMGLGSVYDPQAEQLRKQSSPIEYITMTRTPAMIECGAFTAQYTPACQMLRQGYRWLNLPHELVIYPRTGHGIEEPALRMDSARRQLEWLDRWIH